MAKQTTTLPVQGTASGRVQAWMSGRSEFLSQLLGCAVFNLKNSARKILHFRKNSSSLQCSSIITEADDTRRNNRAGFFMPHGSYRHEFRPSWLLNGTTASVKGEEQRVTELFLIPSKESSSMVLTNQKQALSAKSPDTWLSGQCEFLSQLTGCTVSNYAFMGAIVSAVLAAVALVLACDAVQAYGWAALCGTLAVQAATPMVNEFRKGGNK